MDTTYFGRAFGVMLFKDAYTGQNLLKKYVQYETNKLYAEGIAELKQAGFEIHAIVCDGRKGLLKMYDEFPVQMCQFHQMAIVTRYLTKKPKVPAAIEFRALSLQLVSSDRATMEVAMEQWYLKWESFLNERTINPETLKSTYTHRRLRSALRSLRMNMSWLYTYHDYPHLGIPNTTNAIDGHFAQLKTKLRVHNGLSLTRKKRFIDGFLKA
jgi:hypothetical protein